MQLNNYDVIKRIILSEKSSASEDVNLVTFEVVQGVDKKKIKKAVEEIFKVRVLKVNTLNNKPRDVMFRGRKGRKSGMKKAYVILHQDDTIDVLNQTAH
ncbi:MAG: 50S ribosomal protein L23 [Nitrospinae bacterium]|nr:50S ribosomal protein L23 [Nitrospinota bacterium]